MSELEDAWEIALDEARRKAQNAGSADIAEYLRLRASNDLSRRTGIEWLQNTFMQLAGDANRAGASLQITQEDSHRFLVHHATMVGPRLTVSFGVRSLFIEAGWPRVPSDWFVRGGGLACGRIRHFGREKLNQELLLIKSGDKPPAWVVLGKSGEKEPFRESHAQTHVKKVLSPDYQ